MHTVELLELALAAAGTLGYRIREEWLGGSDGGSCEIGGQKWIFIDPALDASERLDLVTDALRHDPAVHNLPLHPELGNLLRLRKSA